MSKRGLRNSHGRRSVRFRPVRTAESERRFSRLSPKSESGPGGREEVVGSEAQPPGLKPTAADTGSTHGAGVRPRDAAQDSGSFERTLAKARAFDEEERLLARFFEEQPSTAAGDEDDQPLHIPMSKGSRRAMWASLWIFSVSLLGIGGYTVYQRVLMPAPIELGDSSVPLHPPTASQPTAAAVEAERRSALRAREETRATLQEPGEGTGAAAPAEADSLKAAEGAAALSGSNPAPHQPLTAAEGTAALAAAPGVPAEPGAIPAPDQPLTAAKGAAAQAVPSPAPGQPSTAPALAASNTRPGQPLTAAERSAAASAAGALRPQAAAVTETSLAAATDPQRAPDQPPTAANPAAATVPGSSVMARAAATEPAATATPIPQAIAGNVTPSVTELLDVARDFARKGRYLKAQLAYEQALAAEPNSAPALAGIAYTYLNTGDQQTAKQYASRAVALDAQSSQGWIVLGAAQESLGDMVAARESYRHCAAEAVGSYVVECRKLAR
jgi:tetratricopeptide (TPR) repeat protein